MGSGLSERLLKEPGFVADTNPYEHVVDTENGNKEVKEEEQECKHGSSSFLQATFNSVSLLLGIGILSSPYALQKGGWFGLSILLVCGIMFCYTAHILGRCLGSTRGTFTYQQIAEVAFGWKGRLTVTIFLYLEIFAVLVGYTISLSDSLVRIFPDVSLDLGWIKLAPPHLLPLVAILIILPTVWVRDLSWLSYLSLGGVATYLVIVVAIVWAGVFDGLGFHHSAPFIRPGNLATVTGLYAFCYAGHVVFPSIYSSMKQPSQYPKVLIASFLIATCIYTGFAFIGATMFGDDIQSQVTLNVPIYLMVAKISLWVVVLSPLTKYSICLSPIAFEVESFLGCHQPSAAHVALSVLVRSSLMAVILALALALPYFENILAFVGSALGMTMSVIFPCAFYVKIFRRQISKHETLLNFGFSMVALVLGIFGTIASVKNFLAEN